MLLALRQRQSVQVKVELVAQTLVEAVDADGPVNSYYMLFPVELAKHYEELPYDFHLILEVALLSVAVENENDESVQRVRGHARLLRTKQRHFMREEGFEQEHAAFEQVVAADHVFVDVVHEVEGAQTAQL